MSTLQKPAAEAAGQVVTHVINGEHYSGAERVQDLLAERLPEFGFQVTFACVKPDQFDRLRKCQQVPLYNLPMRSRVDMRPVRRLVSIVHKNQSVLIHAHTPRSLMVARLAAMVTGRPLIYHVHSPTSRDTNQALRNWLNNATERFTLTGVDRVIAVSESLRCHMIQQGFDPGRICTVPNGVPSHDSTSMGSCTRQSVVATWTIGTVALFRPRKGLEVLLETMAQLKKHGLPVRLRAVGTFESAEYERQMRQRVSDLNMVDLVDWVGFARDVPAELAKCDLFVLPSLFGEGLPMVVLEAMASRVPIVATRVEGIPEAIRHGQDGILVEPADVDALTDGITSLVTDRQLWQSCRDHAFERHAAQFSDRRMAEQVAQVYQQILGHAHLDYSSASSRTASRSHSGKSG